MNKIDTILNYLKYIDKHTTEQVDEQTYSNTHLREIRRLLTMINNKSNFWICFWLFLIYLKL